MKKSILSLLAVLIFGSTAHAGVLLEPYLGFHTGDFKANGDSTSVSGPVFGGRVGYGIAGFGFGADVMMGSWKADGDKANPSDIGAFVSFTFPVMLRVYGVYAFNTKIATDGGDLEGGPATKLGVGYTGFPMIALNLEYRMSTYDKLDGQDLTSGDTKCNTFGLTVSLPFDL